MLDIRHGPAYGCYISLHPSHCRIFFLELLYILKCAACSRLQSITSPLRTALHSVCVRPSSLHDPHHGHCQTDLGPVDVWCIPAHFHSTFFTFSHQIPPSQSIPTHEGVPDFRHVSTHVTLSACPPMAVLPKAHDSTTVTCQVQVFAGAGFNIKVMISLSGSRNYHKSHELHCSRA